MPRIARIKNPNGIYHIMVRSISDVPLFKNNEDKDKYLMLLKKYLEIFRFKLYSYCLMTTHAHLIIDCNGADISKIMKSINQCYAAYFNKKYNRHGHVFQDRFKSKLVTSNKYLLTLSAYIHNNPKAIEEFKNCTEKYPYSSLGIYLNLATDMLKLIDISKILGYFSDNMVDVRKYYLEFISRSSQTAEELDIEFKNEGSEFSRRHSQLIRDFQPMDIINFISKYTGTHFSIHIKFKHKNAELKALSVIIMRSLCGYSLEKICTIIGNITYSSIYRLNEKGYALITKNEKYFTIIDDLIQKFPIT